MLEYLVPVSGTVWGVARCGLAAGSVTGADFGIKKPVLLLLCSLLPASGSRRELSVPAACAAPPTT